MNKTQSYTLRYFAILREQAGVTEEIFESAASTPAALYDELLTRYDFTLPAERVKAAVNDQFVDMDANLTEGDTIVFIPPVAGG